MRRLLHARPRLNRALEVRGLSALSTVEVRVSSATRLLTSFAVTANYEYTVNLCLAPETIEA